MTSVSYYWIDNASVQLGENGNTVYEFHAENDTLRVINANNTNATMVVDGTLVSDIYQSTTLLPSRVIATDATSKLVHSDITLDQLNEFDDNILSLQQTVANKEDTITGAATTITSNNLFPSLVMTSDAQGKVAVTSIPRGEFETYGERISDLENAEIDLSSLAQDVFPSQTNTYDIGSQSKRWNRVVSTYMDSETVTSNILTSNITAATNGEVRIDGDVFVTGNINTPDGVIDFEYIESNLISSGDRLHDIGNASHAWNDAYIRSVNTNYIRPLNASNVFVDSNLVVAGALIGLDGNGIVPDPDYEDVNSNIVPRVDLNYALGTETKRWTNVWTSGISSTDGVTIHGNLILSENLLGPDGNVFKDIDLTDVTTNIVPQTDGALSIGSETKRWDNVWAETVHGNVDAGNLYGEFAGNLEIEGALYTPSVYAEKGSLLYPSYTFADYQEAGMYLEANASYLGFSIDGVSGVRLGNANIQLDHETIVDGNIYPVGTHAIGSSSNVWDAVYANTVHVDGIVISGDIVDQEGNPVRLDLTSIESNVVAANSTYTLGTPAQPWDAIYGNALHVSTIIGNVEATSLNTTSNISIETSAPTITFQDTSHMSGFIHCDTNTLSIRRGDVNATEWTQVNGQWPFTFDLATNNAVCGGSLSAAGSVVSYASDRRLKEDIQPVSGVLDTIQRLGGYTFTWKHVDGLPMAGEHDIGLVAQDLENAGLGDILLTHAPFDRDETGGSKSGEYFKTIQYEKLHALWAQALKEQMAYISRLEQRLETLEKKQ